MNNLKLFQDYYRKMMIIGDCDSAYPCLRYICDRFELNMEQRYWIAFLYATNYCAPTTYYIYNEFPDFENVDEKRLRLWWKNNKNKLYFQSDRAKVKNFNVFVDIFLSYKKLVGDNQQKAFKEHSKTYEDLFLFASQIYYFGRFSLFNYIEALHELTDIKTEPTFLNLKEAESCRNGLCYVFNKNDYITLHHTKSKKDINYTELQNDLMLLYQRLKNNKDLQVNLWNIETVLCAFKKLFWNKRYLGYYIDRQQEEITIMKNFVKTGVNWKVLDDFRLEFFDHSVLGEKNGWNGIRKDLCKIFNLKTMIIDINKNIPNNLIYHNKVDFGGIDIYNENFN